MAAKQACHILHSQVLGFLHRPTYDALRAALDGAPPLTTLRATSKGNPMSAEPSGSPKMRRKKPGHDPAPEPARHDEPRGGLIYIPDVLFRGSVGSSWDWPPTARDLARRRKAAER